MNWQALLLTASLLVPLRALAVTDPAPGPKDSRVRSLPYDPQQVVRLTSTGLAPLEVILEAGEKPVTIAGATVFTDPQAAKDWLARPSGNVLILQPLHAMEPSVLFVRSVTAYGQERHYAFELHTRDGNVANADDRAAYMTVQFTYQPHPTPEQVAVAAARAEAMRAAAAERATRATLAMAQANAPRNYDYSKRDPEGCPLLAPVYVFDDGNRTTLVFAPHAVLPEIYVINQDGKEAIATTINDTTPTGLQVVLPSVQREMRLRRGGKVCALRNNAFNPIGTQPGDGSGTVSPDVVRSIRGAS
jgi:type IV secretion system protein VirB9